MMCEPTHESLLALQRAVNTTSGSFARADAALAKAFTSYGLTQNKIAAANALAFAESQLADFSTLCASLHRIPTELSDVLVATVLGFLASLAALVCVSGLCCAKGCCFGTFAVLKSFLCSWRQTKEHKAAVAARKARAAEERAIARALANEEASKAKLRKSARVAPESPYRVPALPRPQTPTVGGVMRPQSPHSPPRTPRPVSMGGSPPKIPKVPKPSPPKPSPPMTPPTPQQFTAQPAKQAHLFPVFRPPQVSTASRPTSQEQQRQVESVRPEAREQYRQAFPPRPVSREQQRQGSRPASREQQQETRLARSYFDGVPMSPLPAVSPRAVSPVDKSDDVVRPFGALGEGHNTRYVEPTPGTLSAEDKYRVGQVTIRYSKAQALVLPPPAAAEGQAEPVQVIEGP